MGKDKIFTSEQLVVLEDVLHFTKSYRKKQVNFWKEVHKNTGAETAKRNAEWWKKANAIMDEIIKICEAAE